MAYREKAYAGRDQPQAEQEAPRRRGGLGHRQKADLVLKNATYVNVFCNELSHGDIAVAEGLIAGMGEHYEGAVEVDMGGKLRAARLCRRAHPLRERARFPQGICQRRHSARHHDRHRRPARGSANYVMGTDGIEQMLAGRRQDLPVDVRFMLPSCVPATPLDESGAVLDYRAIDSSTTSTTASRVWPK